MFNFKIKNYFYLWFHILSSILKIIKLINIIFSCSIFYFSMPFYKFSLSNLTIFILFKTSFTNYYLSNFHKNLDFDYRKIQNVYSIHF